SVRGGYCDYYHTRVWMIDKEWGYAPVIEEMYSDSGKLFATHFHPWRRASSYDEKVAYGWYTWAEDLNFPEEGCSYWAAPQTNLGYENPQEWFTLRELKRSVPTVSIPYMAVLPPKTLLSPETLFPEKELQDAYRKYFPQRVEALPGGNPEAPIGIEKWR
ncbi:MAG: hypothetical protein SV775_13850, partial [Thermodesulfobacteriota bacterium]|nr:hypothetical protein [Thermodesulfobacteriota bacterium]